MEEKKRPHFANVKIGKHHHIAKAHPIKDIAKRAAQHETKRENVAACLFPPHPNRNETSDDGGQANQHPSHGIGIGAEKAHRHAEVADEMKVEKGQQLYRLPRLQRERIYHDIFHDLIAQEDDCRGDHAELSVVCLDGIAVFLLDRKSTRLRSEEHSSELQSLML